MTIDFDNPRTHDDVVTERHATRGKWGKKLAALRAGIEAGDGNWDTFYRIGTFKNASGARTAIRNLGRRKHLPGLFDMEARIVTHADGSKTSELWAAMPRPDLAEEEF